MGLGLLKYALFHIISFFYVILVVFIYFSKKKIMTVENYIFSILLTITSILLLVDMSSIILPGSVITNLTLIRIINRFCIMLVSLWLVTFTAYIFVISSRKNQGYVSFKENKEKEYFKNICIIFLFIATIICVLCFTLPLSFEDDNYIVAAGAAVYQKGCSH